MINHKNVVDYVNHAIEMQSRYTKCKVIKIPKMYFNVLIKAYPSARQKEIKENWIVEWNDGYVVQPIWTF